MNTCAKPGCAGSATAVLGYDYSQSRATLEDPGPDPISPHVYALCSSCAEKMRPPRGWTLEDLRSRPPLFLDDARPHRAAAIAIEDEERERRELDLEPAARQLFFGQSA
ncbi:MAG: hypothetical protein QOH90_1587 [Actinomycetota bacterium]|nr:hypothetical protein [Actinomycetota bacterium]